MKKIEWEQVAESGWPAWYRADWRIFHFMASPEVDGDKWEFTIEAEREVLFREVYDSKERLMEDADWRVFAFIVSLASEWAERGE